ncbi:MAG TPA: pantetheine-phosphate adenylyltransferase [Candidatus Limnocylindrales bacterium]|nr:pantetheine-phosphate adenylyltransferase [Candidatus Limnocylindrales bacterium]
MERIAIYPGTFDPITNGHIDVVQRSLNIFDKVIMAVSNNPEKKPLFTLEERIEMIKEAIGNWERFEVDSFQGLLVNYAIQRKATTIIRGIRAVSDFEYEFQMALMNRRLNPSVETVFMMPNDEYSFLSSRIVKEVISLGGSVKGLVPEIVEKKLQEKFKTFHK